MFGKLLRVQLLVFLLLAACSPQEESSQTAPEGNTECPYKLPWPSFLPEVRVSQSISDPTNRSHLPRSLEEFAVDFSMPEGTPIVAARGGVLSAFHDSETQHGSSSEYAKYANYVILDHGDGTFSIYSHLQKSSDPQNPTFRQSDVGTKIIVQGELIGFSGNTGWSTSPHLHFQVQKRGDRFGQSIPFCFSDVEGGVPLLNTKYVSENAMVGVLGAQVEAYTENFNQGMLELTELTSSVSFFALDLNQNATFLVVHTLSDGNENLTQFTTQDPNPLLGLHFWSKDGRRLAVTSGSMISIRDLSSGTWDTFPRQSGDFGQGIANSWTSVFDWVDGQLGEGFLSDCVKAGRDENGVIDYNSYPGICFLPAGENVTPSYFFAPEDNGLTEGSLIYSWPSSDSNFTKVAFIRQYLSGGTPTGSAQLMILDVSTNTFTHLDIGNINPVSTKISPDGKEIAFLGVSGSTSEAGDLWVISLEGNNLKKLTNSSLFFDWSDDGEKIVFTKNNDAWIIDVDSGNETQITDTPNVIEISPTFLPNY